MPGTNLTRDEAASRAALLHVNSYDVVLDLTTVTRDGNQGAVGVDRLRR